jgi:hypothetical protein
MLFHRYRIIYILDGQGSEWVVNSPCQSTERTKTKGNAIIWCAFTGRQAVRLLLNMPPTDGRSFSRCYTDTGVKAARRERESRLRLN